MITYRYGPYEPEENSSWNLDKLMGVLSDMIMKYDIELEEALRMLIDRGMPVNLFLKEGGMEDLVKKYLDSLQEQINSILDKFTLKDALENLESEARDLSKAVEKKFKSDSMKERLKNALSDDSIDELLRLKWDLSKAGEEKPMRALSDLLQNREEAQHSLVRTNPVEHRLGQLVGVGRVDELEEVGVVLRFTFDDGLQGFSHRQVDLLVLDER